MQHTLYLTRIGHNRLAATKLVREVMQFLGTPGEDGPASMADADKLIDAFERDSYALLGVNDDALVLSDVTAQLNDGDCDAVIDLDPDLPGEPAMRDLRREQSREDAAAGKTPEEVFAERAPGLPPPAPVVTEPPIFSTQAYETAMQLLVMTNGMPGNAAGYCHGLARTTEDDLLYREVQDALVKVFPFIAEALDANDLRVKP